MNTFIHKFQTEVQLPTAKITVITQSQEEAELLLRNGLSGKIRFENVEGTSVVTHSTYGVVGTMNQILLPDVNQSHQAGQTEQGRKVA